MENVIGCLPSWGNGLWWVCIGTDTNPRVSRPRAGAVRRPPGGASRALPQASQILGTEKPIECRGSARHRARELEQARGALAELEERAVGRGEERADQPPQIGLMADDRHRTARDRKSTRLNSSHTVISYAVFCL